MNKILTLIIFTVWLINGLFCKVLNLTPRHQEIISNVLSQNYSRELTLIIGILEIIMALWVLSRYKSKVNTIVQITIILYMNIIEFIVVPDLLLWGRFNLIFAFLFCLMIYVNEYKFQTIKIVL